MTLGPTFLSASLYLGIKTLQQHYSAARFWHIGPRLFATLFILGDFISLSFIGVGGSLAAIFAEDPLGVHLMIAGLATQVLFTAIFCGVLAVIYRKTRWKMRCDRTRFFVLGELHRVCRNGRLMTDKLTSTAAGAMSAVCLLIRSAWRVAELSDGFDGPLTSMEGVFFALDSIPMCIMSVLITVFHPKLWFRDSP